MKRLTALWIALFWLAAGIGALWATEPPAANTPILFTADELTHDRELGIVTARGNVEVSQGARVLTANTISFNQRENLLTASGNISLLEHSGDVLFAEYMEITGDFRKGILRDLRVLLSDNARFAAAGARRSYGKLLEMHNAVYSPCDTCARDPGKPPLWQVKARRVVHNQQAQVIEYNDAWLEVDGVPVFYTPFFSHPDPNVRRKSGFLTPRIGASRTFGTSVQTPYYFALAPNRDLTLSPTLTAKERLVLEAEYRHRLAAGQLAGIVSSTYDSENQLRGHIDSEGRFDLNDMWRWGYKAHRATNDTYLRRYNFGTFKALESRAFVEGFRKRNYISAEAYSFQGLQASDDPGETPIVLPLLNFNRVEEPGRFGGRTSLDVNFSALTRTDGTDSRRLTTQVGWQAPFFGRLGDITTLSATVRGDVYHVDDLVQPGREKKFDGLTGRFYPQLRADWRLPFARRRGTINQIIEPLASLVVSPYGGNPDDIPNDDSADVEFDDTNLFVSNRFAGFDRVEGGPRLNYAMKWGVFGARGGSSSVLIGQSYRLREDNTFEDGTGLEGNLSDVVARIRVSPNERLNLTYRTRLDNEDLTPARNEVSLSTGLPSLNFAADYVKFEREGGSEFAGREELSGNVRMQLDRFWRSNLSARYDLEDGGNLRRIGLNLTYECECFLFSATLSRSFFQDRDLKPDHVLVLRFAFKTLGDVKTGVTRSGD